MKANLNQLFLLYSVDAEVVEKQAKEETVVENATPDYAAGLVSTQVRFYFNLLQNVGSLENKELSCIASKASL